MTTHVLRSRKVARSLSWFSTSGDSARSNIQPALKLSNNLHRSTNALACSPAAWQSASAAPSACLHSGASDAAIKSHSA
jgi:hypothetical protein